MRLKFWQEKWIFILDTNLYSREFQDWGCEKGMFVNQLKHMTDLAGIADLERPLAIISEILVSAKFCKPLPTKVHI